MKMIIPILLGSFFMLILSAGPVSAEFQYTLLESFPGFFSAGNVMTDLPGMILAIYKFGIWTIGIAGLFMLVVGGFMYMASAGNTSTAGNAQGIIADALLGIVAALGSYLILYVINPDLTKLNLSFTPQVSITPVSVDMKTLAAQVLSSTAISESSSGDCKDANGNQVSPASNLNELKEGRPMTVCNATCKKDGTPCTGSVTPPMKMLNWMLEVASTGKSFTIVSISGGQHATNSAHYGGLAVDIDADNAEFAGLVDAFEAKGANKPQTACDLNGAFVDCSLANHVHVDFR